MKKRILPLLLTLALLMGLLPQLAISAGAKETVEYIYYEVDADGNEIRKTGTHECEVLTGGNKKYVLGDAKVTNNWWIARGDITFSKRAEVTNNVHLILADGCNVTFEKGIRLEDDDNSLTIYAQSESPNTGSLYAKGTDYDAGIGSDEPFVYGWDDECTGDLTIHGGRITAIGGHQAAGIGGGLAVNGGRVTIYNGDVNVQGGNYAAGIGGGTHMSGKFFSGGGKGGDVTVYGGEIHAWCNTGPGIGDANRESDSGSLTVYGGIIETSSFYSPLTVGAGRVVRRCGLEWRPGYEAFTTPYGNPYRYDNSNGVYPDNKFSGDWTSCLNHVMMCFCVVKPDEPVPYWDYDTTTGNYETNSTEGTYTFVKANTPQWGNGWYVANTDGTFNEPVIVKEYSHARLILQDGVTLTAKKGIMLSQGSTLSVYAQSDAMADGNNAGKLVVEGAYGCAAIGSSNGNSPGNLLVYGGKLDLTGGTGASAIGTKGNFSLRGGILDVKCGAAGRRAIDVSHADPRQGYVFYDQLSGSPIDRPDGKTWAEMLTGDTLSITLTPLQTEGQTPVSYLRWLNDRVGLCAAETTNYQKLADEYTFLSTGCYVLSETATVNARMAVNGTADLILMDGCTLYASKGIYVGEDSTLNIYGQTGGTGKLVAKLSSAGTRRAAIGGGNVDKSDDFNCGTVNIHGGTIDVRGGTYSAGIGGGEGGSGGTVNIYGGTVTALGSTSGAGIGSGSEGSGGTVNIYGGTVNATGGNDGAGIGGGSKGSGGTVNIYGGTVTATGGIAGAGIGGGNEGGGGRVTIEGGTVTATGGSHCPGIGPGLLGASGTIKVRGGEIVARSGEAYIPEVAPGITKEGFTLTRTTTTTILAGDSEETVAYRETLGDDPYVRITSLTAARIGSTYYSTKEDALAAAQPGDTVELLQRWSFMGDYDVPKGVTLAAGQKGVVAHGRLTGSITGNVLLNGTGSRYIDADGREYSMPVGEQNVYICDPTLKPSSWSLNLDNSLRINIYFPEKEPATHVNADGRLFYDAGDVDRDCHCRLGSLNAKEMNETYHVSVVQPGSCVSPTIEVSVRKYAEEKLSRVWWDLEREDIGYKIGRLLVAMLNYGAEAQKYFWDQDEDYKKEDLANANIDQYQEKLPDMPTRTDQRTVSGDAKLFCGTSCILGENMNMKLYFRLEDTTATSLKLKYTDYHGEYHEITVDGENLEDAGDGFVAYTLETLVAGDIDTMVTAILETADGRKVEVEDSISSYLERVKVSNPKCKDIAEKMFQFGFLAKAYFLNLPDPLVTADGEPTVG